MLSTGSASLLVSMGSPSTSISRFSHSRRRRDHLGLGLHGLGFGAGWPLQHHLRLNGLIIFKLLFLPIFWLQDPGRTPCTEHGLLRLAFGLLLRHRFCFGLPLRLRFCFWSSLCFGFRFRFRFGSLNRAIDGLQEGLRYQRFIQQGPLGRFRGINSVDGQPKTKDIMLY